MLDGRQSLGAWILARKRVTGRCSLRGCSERSAPLSVMRKLCRTEIRFRHPACGFSSRLGSYLILAGEAAENRSSADARCIQVADSGDVVGVVVRDALGDALVRARSVVVGRVLGQD